MMKRTVASFALAFLLSCTHMSMIDPVTLAELAPPG